MKLQMLLIRAEGEGVGVALQQFASMFQQGDVVAALPAGEVGIQPVSRPLPASINGVPAGANRARARRTTDLAPADREIAILKLLKFRALRIPEIADALCADKRQVKTMVGRLYPAMAKLKKQGKVKKDGAAWALR